MENIRLYTRNLMGIQNNNEYYKLFKNCKNEKKI